MDIHSQSLRILLPLGVCWERDSSQSSREDPKGKKASAEQGTLTDSPKIFPQSSTQTEAHRAEAETPVHQEQGGRGIVTITQPKEEHAMAHLL